MDDIDLNIVETKLELVTCGYEHFNFSNTNEIEFFGVNNYLCIKNKTLMRSRGTFQSSEYEYLRVYLVPC
jgi:hypothetical protein